MSKSIHATPLVVGTLLLLAGCGGQPPGAQAAQPHGQVSSAPISSAPIEPATTHALAGAVMSNDEMTSLKQQVALLRHEVAEIRQLLARMPAAALSAEAPPNPRTDPNARLEAEQVEQQRIASTETAFRSEREDSHWSQSATAAVHAALAEADESLRNHVSSVECRSQSCRVVIGGGASGSAGQDLSSVMNRLAGTLPNVTAGRIDQGDGRPATVLYFSR